MNYYTKLTEKKLGDPTEYKPAAGVNARGHPAKSNRTKTQTDEDVLPTSIQPTKPVENQSAETNDKYHLGSPSGRSSAVPSVNAHL